MFQATICPGPYLESKLNYIANEVNKRLESHTIKNELTTTNNNLYRVRKNWSESQTQKGAFSVLNNAINCARAAGINYKVYDSQGKEVWRAPAANTLSIGDKVKLSADAVYYNGQSMPAWVKHSEMYVREINGDRVVISTVPTGAITGAVHKKYLTRI